MSQTPTQCCLLTYINYFEASGLYFCHFEMFFSKLSFLICYRKTPYTERRRSIHKSPHPKKFKTQEGSSESTSSADTVNTISSSELDLNLDDINNQLESILNILDSVCLLSIYCAFFLILKMYTVVCSFFSQVFFCSFFV